MTKLITALTTATVLAIAFAPAIYTYTALA